LHEALNLNLAGWITEHPACQVVTDR
jgi:hypothetical protein